MTTKEMVIKVLNKYSCLNSNQIKVSVYNEFGEVISAQSAAGILRPLIARGLAAKSTDASGKMTYWLTAFGKQELIKE